MAPRGSNGSRLVKALIRLGALALVLVMIARLSRALSSSRCDCHHHLHHLHATSGGAGGGNADINVDEAGRAAGAGDSAVETELRQQLEDALEEIARLKKTAGSESGHHWWSRHSSGSSSSSGIDNNPKAAPAAVCTNAVMEKSAKLKIAQLRSQLGEDRGTPCAKKELEEMDAKTARVKQLVAQVTASKCGGAVLAERDFWQQRVFRLMSSAVLSEARAKLYEPSDVFGEELSEKELRMLKRSLAEEEKESSSADEGGDASEGGGENNIKGTAEGDGGDVESSVRAFDRTLLSVGDSLADILEPRDVARALLAVGTRSYHGAAAGRKHGGSTSDGDGDEGGTSSLSSSSYPRVGGLRRTVAPTGTEKKSLSAGVEKAGAVSSLHTLSHMLNYLLSHMLSHIESHAESH